MSLYCKTKIITPLMHNVLDGGMMKSEMLLHLSVAKRGYVLGSAPVGSYSIRSLQVDSLAANGRLLLRLHDVVSVGCEQHAQQPLAMAVVGVNVFRTFARTRACAQLSFVQFSARNLTL